MGYETIRYEPHGPVGVLTLDRPRCLNAINRVMRDELRSFFRDRMDDPEARVIVLTGADRGFSSGLDIRDQSLTNPDGGFDAGAAYRAQCAFSEIILLMRRCPQPILGAINGVAVGAGFSMAMACDIRLGSAASRFQAAYINLGFGGADMGSSWLLPRAIGTGNAARYLMSGDFMSAQEALRIGFLQQLVEPDQLLATTMALANNLAGKSPLGLRLTKEALESNSAGCTLEQAIRLEDRNQAMCITQLSAARAR